MTNEKAIMNLESWQIDLPTNSLQFEVFEKAIKALIIVESCKKETGYGWIPVSERLPEKNGEYLITGRQGAVNKRRYHDGHWYGNWSVLAWMPLPDAYEGGEKNG